MNLPEYIMPLNVIPIGWQIGKEKQKYTEGNIYLNKWRNK